MRGVRRDWHDVDHLDVSCRQMLVLRRSLTCLKPGRQVVVNDRNRRQGQQKHRLVT